MRTRSVLICILGRSCRYESGMAVAPRPSSAAFTPGAAERSSYAVSFLLLLGRFVLVPRYLRENYVPVNLDG